MRVIAGTYRSRPLVSPGGLATRPTTDRLRETLFDVLAERVQGACFADLYAGSGAIGIEALSRGAGQVWFVEQALPALRAIRSNLRSLGIESGFHIESRGVSPALAGLARQTERRPWDIVFLDPPYDARRAYSNTLSTLGDPAVSLLAPNGMVVVEHRGGRRAERETVPKELYGRLKRSRMLTQGDAALSFYRLVGA